MQSILIWLWLGPSCDRHTGQTQGVCMLWIILYESCKTPLGISQIETFYGNHSPARADSSPTFFILLDLQRRSQHEGDEQGKVGNEWGLAAWFPSPFFNFLVIPNIFNSLLLFSLHAFFGGGETTTTLLLLPKYCRVMKCLANQEESLHVLVKSLCVCAVLWTRSENKTRLKILPYYFYFIVPNDILNLA